MGDTNSPKCDAGRDAGPLSDWRTMGPHAGARVLRDAKNAVVTRMTHQQTESYDSICECAWAIRLTNTAPAELEEIADNRCPAGRRRPPPAGDSAAGGAVTSVETVSARDGVKADRRRRVYRVRDVAGGEASASTGAERTPE